MRFSANDFVRSAALTAILLMAAACADQKQTEMQPPQAAPVSAVQTAQTAAPAIAVPQTAEVPVPAYGPSPHPVYYYPPVGLSMPGR